MRERRKGIIHSKSSYRKSEVEQNIIRYMIQVLIEADIVRGSESL